MLKVISFILIVVAISSCLSPEKKEKVSVKYFRPESLSKDYFVDSISNIRFSKILSRIKENSFLNLSKNKCSYRILVASSIYNPYCIRMDRSDSLLRVTFKIASDRENFVRAGLNNLTLTYESTHERMVALFDSLYLNFNKYDFYPGFDNAEGFVVADGTSYLLERACNGEYKVVVGHDGGQYRGKDELFQIIKKMHFLIPVGLLPDLENAKELEDVLFPVLKKDTVRNAAGF